MIPSWPLVTGHIYIYFFPFASSCDCPSGNHSDSLPWERCSESLRLTSRPFSRFFSKPLSVARQGLWRGHSASLNTQFTKTTGLTGPVQHQDRFPSLLRELGGQEPPHLLHSQSEALDSSLTSGAATSSPCLLLSNKPLLRWPFCPLQCHALPSLSLNPPTPETPPGWESVSPCALGDLLPSGTCLRVECELFGLLPRREGSH